jgi:hypothetical protein
MRIDTSDQAEMNIKATGGFGIRASAKAFMLLSSGLYKNPIRAIVREICTNAIDAHVAAGYATRPFEVDLPTEYASTFAVRDYGLGLSEEDIRDTYTIYFESTRAESQDATGGLGLGCKSPFGYTNQFSVTSYYGGVEYIYSMFTVDHEPQYKLISATPSPEPSGVRVIVPVKSGDRNAFLREASSVLPVLMTQPIVNGEPPETAFSYYSPSTFAGGMVQIVKLINNGKSPNASIVAGGDGMFGVRQGGVVYPLVLSTLTTRAGEDQSLTTEDRAAIAQLGEIFNVAKMGANAVLLNVPIGSVYFTPNREELLLDRASLTNIAAIARKVSTVYLSELDDIWTTGLTPHEQLDKIHQHPLAAALLALSWDTVTKKHIKPKLEATIEQINEEWRAQVGASIKTVVLPTRPNQYQPKDATEVQMLPESTLTRRATLIDLVTVTYRNTSGSRFTSQPRILLPVNAQITPMHRVGSDTRMKMTERDTLGMTASLKTVAFWMQPNIVRDIYRDAADLAVIGSDAIARGKFIPRVYEPDIDRKFHHLSSMCARLVGENALGGQFHSMITNQDEAITQAIVDALLTIVLTDDRKSVILEPSDRQQTSSGTFGWYVGGEHLSARQILIALKKHHKQSMTVPGTEPVPARFAILRGAKISEIASRLSENASLQHATEMKSNVPVDKNHIFDLAQIAKIKLPPTGPRAPRVPRSIAVRQLTGRDKRTTSLFTRVVKLSEALASGDTHYAVRTTGAHGLSKYKATIQVGSKSVPIDTDVYELTNLLIACEQVLLVMAGQRPDSSDRSKLIAKYKDRLIFFTPSQYDAATKGGMNIPTFESYLTTTLNAITARPDMVDLISGLEWTHFGDITNRTGAHKHIARMKQVLRQVTCDPTFTAEVEQWDKTFTALDVLTNALYGTRTHATNAHQLPPLIRRKEQLMTTWAAWLARYPLSVIDSSITITPTICKHIATYTIAIATPSEPPTS